MLKKKRCWYCRRTGRFGFKRNRLPSQAPECRSNRRCFARARLSKP